LGAEHVVLSDPATLRPHGTHADQFRRDFFVMTIRTTAVAAALLAAWGLLPAARQASAVDYTWNVLGGGTQSWTSAANWNPNTGTPSTSADTADLRVGLGSSLALDLGASGTVTSGSISFGGTSGAVTTDVTSSGAALVLNNAAANGQILSQGVAGSVNRISAPLILGKSTDVLAAGTRDFAITGTLGQVGGAFTLANQLAGGPTLTIGSGAASRIQLYDSLTPATGRNLTINNLSSASGTAQATVINALWDRGATNGTLTLGNSQNPAAVYSLLVSQTSPANVQINRSRYVVAADNALGLGEVTANNSSTQNWGGVIQSNDDARVLGNPSFRISNLIAFTGSNSLTITGTFYQSNSRGFGNNLPAGKQLNLNGTIAMDSAAGPRTMVVEGSGKTVMNGRVINAFTDTAQGTLIKRGTGRLELTNATNTLSGTWSSQGGLIVFGTAGSYGTAVIQTGSSGGVSYAPGTGDAGWATFVSRLTASSTNFGYLALPAADSAANLDFTTTLAGAPNLSVVGDGAMTYTGVVTPGASGYNWGGLSGVLTLPTNASVGSNTVRYTNGGTVIVAGSQGYTGATTVQGVLMTTSQNGITSGTGAFNVAATIAFPSTLSVASVADGGSPSSLGASSNAAANLVLDRATLRHTGASSSSTDRLFTIGVNGATLESTGAGAVTFGSGGGANVTAGTGARALTLGGTSTAANTVTSILANGTTGSDLLSLVKTDAGTWVLGGANTYTGTTAVLAGTLLVNGNQSAATGAVSVASAAVLGGTGTTGGNVAFGSGGLFAFNATAPLTVSGSVTFASPATFGVASLVGLSNSVPDATYPLIAGNVNLTGLANFGSGNAYDLGSGKSAYFEALSPSGLSLVVVPEPTSIAGAISSLGLIGILLRRRRRAG
jgi:autotransporter-associated beta strand protein